MSKKVSSDFGDCFVDIVLLVSFAVHYFSLSTSIIIYKMKGKNENKMLKFVFNGNNAYKKPSDSFNVNGNRYFLLF